ncbi:MAG: thioredoxin domain-containing protein [Alphaproteobacteria bacterium]|nr:thioredoxin domain-containing protein [Alphaproteobacteria bacterium]
MSRNALADETSPYLLQHQDNPVHWLPWGPTAFAKAKAEGKPVLLSVGYAACHWCHVMAHESFENEETARLMNELFVCIKVDREERPDVDMLYQTALGQMGHTGGWPLTMFLTAEGEPFGGGTYFPPEPRFGRPGFRDVLQEVGRIYSGDPARTAQVRGQLMQRLSKLWATDQKKTLTRSHIEVAARRVTQAQDVFFGGFDGAPKFPQANAFEQIWRGFLRSGAEPFYRAAVLALDNICQGGIYDHLGGGFARYSTDDRWLVPHFEKMLYDNAQLIGLLTLVWQRTRSPLYKQRIDETFDWLSREMVTEGGAFAASLDADSEGEEGRYYLWTEAEIDAVLGAGRSLLFKQVYDVTAEGNWEGRCVLNRLRARNYLAPEQEAALAGQRKLLLKARGERPRPAWDDKVLADWNGLAIAALENAAAVFQEPRYHLAAVKAFGDIIAKLTTGQNGERLFHTCRAGKAHITAVAEDYANMAAAALALYETTLDKRYLEKAELWTRTLDRHYWDEVNGGYFTTADDAEALPIRARVAADHATPSANGTMVGVLTRLYYFTGETRYRRRAEDTANAFGTLVEQNVAAAPALLNNLETLLNPVQITLVRAPGDPQLQPLLRAVYLSGDPNRIVQLIGPQDTLPKTHPAHGKTMQGGKATAYVCVGETCSPPVTDPKQLERMLTRPVPR